jgi:hypothetical protein
MRIVMTFSMVKIDEEGWETTNDGEKRTERQDLHLRRRTHSARIILVIYKELTNAHDDRLIRLGFPILRYRFQLYSEDFFKRVWCFDLSFVLLWWALASMLYQQWISPMRQHPTNWSVRSAKNWSLQLRPPRIKSKDEVGHRQCNGCTDCPLSLSLGYYYPYPYANVNWYNFPYLWPAVAGGLLNPTAPLAGVGAQLTGLGTGCPSGYCPSGASCSQNAGQWQCGCGGGNACAGSKIDETLSLLFLLRTQTKVS